MLHEAAQQCLGLHRLDAGLVAIVASQQAIEMSQTQQADSQQNDQRQPPEKRTQLVDWWGSWRLDVGHALIGAAACVGEMTPSELPKSSLAGQTPGRTSSQSSV